MAIAVPVTKRLGGDTIAPDYRDDPGGAGEQGKSQPHRLTHDMKVSNLRGRNVSKLNGRNTVLVTVVILYFYSAGALICAQTVGGSSSGASPAASSSREDSSYSGSSSSVENALQIDTSSPSSSGPEDPLPATCSTITRQTGVDWGHLFASSAAFLAVAHSFRYASEATTRRSFHEPFFPYYGNAVANLHGWADGDPFIVNWVGHPMEGAVAGFIWQHNDRAFRTAEFGRNRRYWKARMRGMAFAYVYSVQFEIGPFSEASIGHIQGMYPQIGFVDHVVTPIIGTGWAITEDAIDRMLIQRFEQHVANPYARLLARGVLNPSRSFANLMELQVPWHRDDRPGVFKPFPESALWVSEDRRRVESTPVDPPPGVAPFDFAFHSTFMDYLNNGSAGICLGGGGTAGFRVADDWQIVLDVSGCKMMNFRQGWSGDSLTYMAGPRWTPRQSRRWTPHAQVLFGGTKVTQEYENPYLKSEVADWHPVNDEGRTAKHAYYSADWDRNGVALVAGGGVDYRLNSALAFRLADLDYAHSWAGDINGINYHNAVQFSGGLVLRMGTW